MKEIILGIKTPSEKPAVGRSKRRLRRLLVVFFSLGMLAWGGWFWLTRYLEQRLVQVVTDAGMQITYQGMLIFIFFRPEFPSKMLTSTQSNPMIVFRLLRPPCEGFVGMGKNLLSGHFLEFSRLELHDGELFFSPQDTLHDSLSDAFREKNQSSKLANRSA
jgi:hypothetical protein